MRITRRAFMKYCAVAAGALGLTSTDLLKLQEALAKEGGADVIWMHGASCTGDSTSLLNTIYYTDPVGLLVTGDLDLEFHQTVMNASGTDLASATDGLLVAQLHLPGSIQNFAGWSTDTRSDGTKSIKLRVGDRSNPMWYVDAKVYPVAPLKVNEFTISLLFKTSEEQAPYIELDLENQDTGGTETIHSHYPSIVGPTDWRRLTLPDFLMWKIGVGPPGSPPVGYVDFAAIRGLFGTWRITRAKIVNRGNPVFLGTFPCTIYIDEIVLGGIHYEDESSAIAFNSHPEPVEGPFVLAIEGSVLTATPLGVGTLAGQYCEVGPMVAPGDPDETMLHAFLEYAKAAAAVLAIGTCASYGGIPAAKGSVTGAKGCKDVLKSYGITTPVVNIPGCPAHPDWIVGTIAQYLAKGLEGIELDRQGRPRDFYGSYVCNGNIDVKCPWIYNNDQNDDGSADDPAYPIGESGGLAKYKWSSVPAPGVTYDGTSYSTGYLFEGCLGVLGCRGRKTKADCAYRKWNAQTTLTPGTLGVNWCVGSRGGCQGCTEPTFPSKSKFYTFR